MISEQDARAESLIECLGHELSWRVLLVLKRKGELNMRQIALQAHATSTRVKDSLHRLERLNMVQVKGPEGVFGRDVWRLNFADPRTARVLAILEEEA